MKRSLTCDNRNISNNHDGDLDDVDSFITPKKIYVHLHTNAVLCSSLRNRFSRLSDVKSSILNTMMSSPSELLLPPGYHEYVNADFPETDYSLQCQKTILIRKALEENADLRGHANDKIYLYETLHPSDRGIQAIYMAYLHATSYAGNEIDLQMENASLQCFIGRMFASLTSNRHALWKLTFFSCFTLDEIKKIWKANIEDSASVLQELKLTFEFDSL
jgi:hypothetical protein